MRLFLVYVNWMLLQINFLIKLYLYQRISLFLNSVLFVYLLTHKSWIFSAIILFSPKFNFCMKAISYVIFVVLLLCIFLPGNEESVRWRAMTEEHARDSFENILFSVCRFRELTGTYPHNITVSPLYCMCSVCFISGITSKCYFIFMLGKKNQILGKKWRLMAT